MRYDYDDAGIKGNYIFDNKDGWFILKAEGYKLVSPAHRCSHPPVKDRLCGGLSGVERCVYCREVVPDNVQALVRLYNWGIE